MRDVPFRQNHTLKNQSWNFLAQVSLQKSRVVPPNCRVMLFLQSWLQWLQLTHFRPNLLIKSCLNSSLHPRKKRRNVLKQRQQNEIKSTMTQYKNNLLAATKKFGTFAAERPLDSWELDCLVQRLLFLAVLTESHDAVKLFVVLTANLTAELIHLVLKVNRFRLTAGSSSHEGNTRLRGKSQPVVSLHGRAVISKSNQILNIKIDYNSDSPTPTLAWTKNAKRAMPNSHCSH